MKVCALLVLLSAVGLSVSAWAGPPAAVESSNAQPPMGSPACGEARYPFDAQDAWLHGYFQEVPAFDGFAAFRPYNYKHVFVQSQIAAGWGMTSPYSQQIGQHPRAQAARTRLWNVRPVSYQR